ncbi:hypothetical protein IMZ08_18620 [Bacillus luteolus]|uniref:ATP synthase F0 subunit 8 n=1 Tax=Litchfieldia luteola TaxID=682179 RepID=A0ABR9QNH4_9BACI|nr:hypothetical protein [Cytobacillus luteolus]MBE4910055.1 hypothetical protein [Cytobacillus luteolus]MBP1942383.1 hypothetical protein [Cytobacillus luteolus]
MLRFTLITTAIVIFQLIIFYYLSPMFNLKYYDAVFLFGTLTTALSIFSLVKVTCMKKEQIIVHLLLLGEQWAMKI